MWRFDAAHFFSTYSQPSETRAKILYSSTWGKHIQCAHTAQNRTFQFTTTEGIMDDYNWEDTEDDESQDYETEEEEDDSTEEELWQDW